MNEASKSILSPLPKGRVAKRGDCGTCQWFERVPEQPRNNQPWAGWCLYNPPVPSQTFEQLSIAGAGGQQVRPVMQGVVPPTFETRRCSKWWPAGALTPFDDRITHEALDGKE